MFGNDLTHSLCSLTRFLAYATDVRGRLGNRIEQNASFTHPREKLDGTTTGNDAATTTTMTSSRGDTWRKTADRPPADEQEKIGRVRLGAGNLRRRRRCLRRSGEDNDEGNMPAYPSECSALSYVTARQIDDSVNYCRSLINTRFENSENLYRKDLLSHYGCVNAIEFSNQGDLLVSGEAR